MIQPKYLYRKNNNITNIITHMRTTLKNPYYFTKDNVIFKISDSNPSEDACGKHYKKFDTEQKQLKRVHLILILMVILKLLKMMAHIRLQ